jgi:hypothetical protein
MKQFRMHMSWKYHNETLCIDILNKQKSLFFLLKNKVRKVKQVLSGDCYQWEERGYKERM